MCFILFFSFWRIQICYGTQSFSFEPLERGEYLPASCSASASISYIRLRGKRLQKNKISLCFPSPFCFLIFMPVINTVQFALLRCSWIFSVSVYRFPLRGYPSACCIKQGPKIKINFKKHRKPNSISWLIRTTVWFLTAFCLCHRLFKTSISCVPSTSVPACICGPLCECGCRSADTFLIQKIDIVTAWQHNLGVGMTQLTAHCVAHARTYAAPAHHASPLGTAAVCLATHRGFNIQLWGAAMRFKLRWVSRGAAPTDWWVGISAEQTHGLPPDGGRKHGRWLRGCFFFFYFTHCSFLYFCLNVLCVQLQEGGGKIVHMWHSSSDWHSLHHLSGLEGYLGHMNLVPISTWIWGVGWSCKGAICKNLEKKK